MFAANINANINSISMLNGSNFKSWHENLSIVLAVIDLDLALRVDSPLHLTDESTLDDKRDIERSERSNRMYIMIMKKVIPEPFRDSMFARITTTKEFLAKIEKGFDKNERAGMSTLLTNLILVKYKGKDKDKKKNKDKEVVGTAPQKKQQKKSDDQEAISC